MRGRPNHNHNNHTHNHNNHHHHKKLTDEENAIFERYKKKLKKNKQSRGAIRSQKELEVRKATLTTDSLSLLFYEFESEFSTIANYRDDQAFRATLKTLNVKKRRNKAKSYEAIRQFFSGVFDHRKSQHPLSILIVKYCNLFHGRYSFSPEDFKHKSIAQMLSAVCDVM